MLYFLSSLDKNIGKKMQNLQALSSRVIEILLDKR